MDLGIVGGLGVAGAVAAFLLYRRGREDRHLRQIALAFPVIQLAAFDHPVDAETGLMEVVERQCFRTALGFRLVYTCDPTATGEVVHHLSGQMVRPNRPQLTRSMLLILAILMEQCKAAGIKLEGRFEIGESELGTQHLEFTLSAEEHEALRQVNVNAAGKPVLIGAASG